jgi:hypothetical protein
MRESVRAFGAATLLVVVAVGCQFDANEVWRGRSNETTPRRDVLTPEDERARRWISVSVYGDPPGNDNRRPNGEVVTLSNSSTSAIQIGGWSLCDSPSPCFTFPPGTSIPADGSVRLYSGFGAPTATSFYMGSERGVWDDEHDVATLLRGETVIAQDIY